MSLEPMWASLEKYQWIADKHGFGEEWKNMATERTVDAAAKAAAQAAWATGVAVVLEDANGAAQASACMAVAVTYLDFGEILLKNTAQSIEQENAQ